MIGNQSGVNGRKRVNVSVNKVDYNVVEQQLVRLKFRAKKNLPFIQKGFHFHGYGFENKNDRKLLCKYTKQLMKKYPKTQNIKKIKN